MSMSMYQILHKINYVLNDIVETKISAFRIVGSCRLCLFLDDLQIIAVIIMFAGNFKIIDLRHIFNKFQWLKKATL